MRVLSIDFDYFIDIGVETRNDIFPDGVDFMTPKETEALWESAYKQHPEIKYIGVIPKEYQAMERFLMFSRAKMCVKENHREIIKFLTDNISPNSFVEMVNIDFHHDNYISSGNKLDCANWLRFFAEKYKKHSIKWVKREDSETVSLSGNFPYYTTDNIKEVLQKDYDYIFICYSPEWTPPHLRRYYSELVKFVKSV